MKGYTKRVSCYVGNLAWWTSDKDLSEAIQSLGVTDLIEIKFYENKVNGQSKGFALVTAGSDQSFRTHGQAAQEGAQRPGAHRHTLQPPLF